MAVFQSAAGVRRGCAEGSRWTGVLPTEWAQRTWDVVVPRYLQEVQPLLQQWLWFPRHHSVGSGYWWKRFPRKRCGWTDWLFQKTIDIVILFVRNYSTCNCFSPRRRLQVGIQLQTGKKKGSKWERVNVHTVKTREKTNSDRPFLNCNTIIRKTIF